VGQVRALVVPADVSREITPDTIDIEPAGGGEGIDGGVLGAPVGAIVAQTPAPRPQPVAQVVRVSALQAPRLVRKLAPSYPELARAARVTGVVVVEAEVDALGLVRGVRVLSGHPLLVEAAASAVGQWRYQPLLLGGVPTAFVVTVNVTFALNRP
jgi:protein TonB